MKISFEEISDFLPAKSYENLNVSKITIIDSKTDIETVILRGKRDENNRKLIPHPVGNVVIA